MEYYIYNGGIYPASTLMHYGTKGMHWGTRHWQNEDGTFNEAGKQRYFGRGSGENYHKVAKVRGGVKKLSSKSSGPKDYSFDKERAKKIAKNVAIGAAVVGGTALAIYGAKKFGTLDISDKARAAVANMREQKLSDLKLKEQFKLDKAQIKADAKTQLTKIREDGKLNIATVKMNPESRIDHNILKSEIAKSNDRGKLKEFIKSLKDDEVERINSGKATLNDIRKERNINGWSPNQQKYSDYYKKYGEYFGKAVKTSGKVAGNMAKKTYSVTTSDKAKKVYKTTAKTIGKATKATYKGLTSDKAKQLYKNAGRATVRGVKATAYIAKSTAQVAKLAAEHPNETRAGINYAKRLINGSNNN